MLRRLRYGRYAALAGLLLFLALVVAPAFAPAADDDPLQTYLQIQKQAADNKSKITQEIAASKTKKTAYDKEIADLDSQMVVLGTEVQAAHTAINSLNGQIDEAETAIDDATARMNERQAYLESRLREIYINGDITMMDVLFSSASFDEFIVTYDMVERIMEQDKAALDGITAERELIQQEEATLEKKKADQEYVLSDLEAKNKELSQLQDSKAKASDELTMSIAQLEDKYAEEEAASKAAEEMIKQIMASRPKVAYYGGQFMWPLPASCTNITSEYGMRLHPILKKNVMHTGIDIGAKGGTEIYAVGVGEIIFEGWNGGYGNCVMIDHGGGIVTLYAHMSSFGDYKKGDTVVATNVIGYVGSTGQSTGNHLHFEVRVNGSPVDPHPYLGR